MNHDLLYGWVGLCKMNALLQCCHFAHCVHFDYTWFCVVQNDYMQQRLHFAHLLDAIFGISNARVAAF